MHTLAVFLAKATRADFVVETALCVRDDVVETWDALHTQAQQTSSQSVVLTLVHSNGDSASYVWDVGAALEPREELDEAVHVAIKESASSSRRHQ